MAQMAISIEIVVLHLSSFWATPGQRHLLHAAASAFVQGHALHVWG